MKLLVTEKDLMVQKWFALQAADLGIQLTFARDSGEARAAIANEPPDCVLLDASTGAEEEAPLWSQLRRAPETQHIPVVLYSSSERWQRVVELAAPEVDGFLPLPFTTEALIREARRAAVERASREDAN
jgi:CheY-like chemotaxis protein